MCMHRIVWSVSSTLQQYQSWNHLFMEGSPSQNSRDLTDMRQHLKLSRYVNGRAYQAPEQHSILMIRAEVTIALMCGPAVLPVTERVSIPESRGFVGLYIAPMNVPMSSAPNVLSIVGGPIIDVDSICGIWCADT